MKGGGAGFVGGIVQHIDILVSKERKMTDDGANERQPFAEDLPYQLQLDTETTTRNRVVCVIE